MSTPTGPQDPYDAQPPSGGYGAQPPGGGYGSAPPPPNYYGGSSTPPSPPPPNYLVWAILSTILCCLPVGIFSIVFSTQVNTKWAAGDVEGAYASSKKAKQFAIWAAVAGVVVIVLYLVLVFAVGLSIGGLENLDSY
ncbi:CD225/dispanin family protein [Actinotalea sp. K2]|uniref:CD225/dispanin family protein n=1 Tax=Actinotalea sp. K2 TaxID=2939438 RepID=UPI002016A94F|nr:CD225/dispanin family protein [Actinotalea sp. K2]MCL3861877.1 CD225/dispanin family protein [Actinotalea sp. K2]